jgi:hypothetical protein
MMGRPRGLWERARERASEREREREKEREREGERERVSDRERESRRALGAPGCGRNTSAGWRPWSRPRSPSTRPSSAPPASAQAPPPAAARPAREPRRRRGRPGSGRDIISLFRFAEPPDGAYPADSAWRPRQFKGAAPRPTPDGFWGAGVYKADVHSSSPLRI